MAMSEKVKKRFKKELISGVICAGLLIGAYCGCESYIDKQVQEWNAIEYIGVSNDGIYKNEVNFKTVDEIKAYKPTIDFYSSNIYYNELNSQEKFVYDTIKYAYENNITHLFFDIIISINNLLFSYLSRNNFLFDIGGIFKSGSIKQTAFV